MNLNTPSTFLSEALALRDGRRPRGSRLRGRRDDASFGYEDDCGLPWDSGLAAMDGSFGVDPPVASVDPQPSWLSTVLPGNVQTVQQLVDQTNQYAKTPGYWGTGTPWTQTQIRANAQYVVNQRNSSAVKAAMGLVGFTALWAGGIYLMGGRWLMLLAFPAGFATELVSELG